jgi:NTP pyrophosphatase (non-canonical NTP hydrolase)
MNDTNNTTTSNTTTKNTTQKNTLVNQKESHMTIHELVKEYKHISTFLNEKWPLKSHDQRVFARTMKIVEELGELADEILTSMNLQRNSKIETFTKENIEDEFADVLASLILLANEMDLDVETIMKRKLQFTRDRFEMDEQE